jgi:hypothetical protein
MILVPPIFAFGFVNLPTLGWLALAAAPILIHLWNRRRFQESSWAAMTYLKAAFEQQARRLRFERWFLLLVRITLILCLVLAAAEPYVERGGLHRVSGGQAHYVLVVDGSYSMGYKPTEKSRFDHAKELARQVVEESSQGDAFTLVLMASPPRVIVGTPALDPAELTAELDNLQITQTPGDLPATMAAVAALVQNVQYENPRFKRHEVCFFTDLQCINWTPSAKSVQSPLSQCVRSLADAASLTLIDVGQPNANNLAVTNLRPLDPVPMVNRAMTLNVDLRNLGHTIRREQSIELWLDGRCVERKQVNVPVETDIAVGFTCRFDTPGDHLVEVRTPGDALELDNHRYLVLPVREAIRVLCIDGHPSGTAFHGAADYLALALSPKKGRSDATPVQVETATENTLLERPLGGFDCVFLCNVAQFTSGESQVLENYLENGGNLVFFLGDQVQADRYNEVLRCRSDAKHAKQDGAGQGGDAAQNTPQTPAMAGSHLLPARLGTVVDKPQFRLDPLEYRHPIVQPFRGRGQAGLLTTPVFKHFKLEPFDDAQAQTVLALADGDPLIVEQPVHRGKVVLVATSADASWTAMPLWSSFVPLVHEISTWCAASQWQQRMVKVGDPIEVSVGNKTPDSDLTMLGPDGRSRIVPHHGNAEANEVRYSETAQSGFYSLRFGGQTDRSQAFAVNPETVESDLAHTGEETLREAWPGVPFAYQTSWPDASSLAMVGSMYNRRGLPVDLLYVALGLVLFESFLAFRSGHHQP